MNATPKIGFISLGCPKALVDSERILTQLKIDGYQISPSYDNADLVIVNTCGFIESAVNESLETIGEAMSENGKVIVTGCLGVKESLIREKHPQVLGVTGPHAYEETVSQVYQHLPKPTHNPYIDLVPKQGIKLTPKHYAYLKISEGCNHRCRFCIIPSLRGDLVSRPINEIMQEAEGLAKAGVKELLVISQDTSAYGVDLKYRTEFWKGRPLKSQLKSLCEALGSLGIWVRLHYVYPYPHVDDIIPLMAEQKILPYLDIPFQHASPAILKSMKRPAQIDNTLARIQHWREICPDITLRSTFIVGFPGETEHDFQLLLDFLDEAQLDRVGCFQYSPIEGAAANELPNPIPDEIKEERYHQFMQKQAEISANKLIKKIDSVIDVIIDHAEEDGFVGRSQADAPEIDGLVYVKSKAILNPGDIVSVKITEADDYDLWGIHKS